MRGIEVTIRVGQQPAERFAGADRRKVLDAAVARVPEGARRALQKRLAGVLEGTQPPATNCEWSRNWGVELALFDQLFVWYSHDEDDLLPTQHVAKVTLYVAPCEVLP